MPNDIPQLEAYSMAQFQRRTGCSDWAARGIDCETFSQTASLYAIMHAKKKPPHCSDVRWRIELRRRAKQKELGKYYVGATLRHRR